MVKVTRLARRAAGSPEPRELASLYHAASFPSSAFTLSKVCEVWRGRNGCQRFLTWRSEVPGLTCQEVSPEEDGDLTGCYSGHPLLVGLWFVPRLDLLVFY